MTVSHSEIIEIFRTSVPASVAPITDNARPLLDTGVDSLDFANFLLALEERYAVKISDADMEKLVSVNDVVKFLNARAG